MTALSRVAERIFGRKVTVRLATTDCQSRVLEVRRRAWSYVVAQYADDGVIHAIGASRGMEKFIYGTVHRGQTYMYVDRAAFDKQVNAYLMIDREFAGNPTNPTDAFDRVMKSLDADHL